MTNSSNTCGYGVVYASTGYPYQSVSVSPVDSSGNSTTTTSNTYPLTGSPVNIPSIWTDVNTYPYPPTWTFASTAPFVAPEPKWTHRIWFKDKWTFYLQTSNDREQVLMNGRAIKRSCVLK